ncbi:MAG: glycosyltransferase family 2 protein [Flavobacteriaceae bacterium]|nr:glycosyltransferase family 2 protein [Flavobacteriaceae bacterium]
MKFSLIICTYMRPKSLLDLLESVKDQTLYPNQIIIVDGSTNDDTSLAIQKTTTYKNLEYYKVKEEERGLTRQRNFGIHKISKDSDVVCFLDDDTVLEKSYFEEISSTYQNNPEITGVGGVALNENRWVLKEENKKYSPNKYYEFEEYVVQEGQRNIIRNYLGLQSDRESNIMPEFSNGRTFGYPLTGKTYEVDLLIGMSFSFHRKVFDSILFSTYFEGYGLYEDADYSLRALKFGKNAINTNAQLNHYHHPDGRPNKYKFGKMVVRNGWYVWRVKYPNVSFKSRVKWNLIIILLAMIRFSNVFTSSDRKGAFTESVGRIHGWFTLVLNKPKNEKNT